MLVDEVRPLGNAKFSACGDGTEGSRVGACGDGTEGSRVGACGDGTGGSRVGAGGDGTEAPPIGASAEIAPKDHELESVCLFGPVSVA